MEDKSRYDIKRDNTWDELARDILVVHVEEPSPLKTPRLYFMFPDKSEQCDGNTHVFPADSNRCLCGRFVEA